MRISFTLSAALLVAGQLVAQWTPLGSGMFSNRSLCQHQGDLYCATYPNGVKKSANGTGPFTAVNNGLPLLGANYFVQSVGSDGAYIYAGTESGIYRSGDGGDTWNNINGTLTASPSVYANKFFNFGTTLLAVFTGTIGEGGGIYRSGNFGNTWLLGHSGMGSNVTVYHVTQVGATLWASTSVGLYTSTDNAQNWMAHPTANFATYSLASLNNTLVIACTYGMRYSNDGGNNWSDGTGDPSAPIDGEVAAFDGAFLALLPAPSGCLRSTDNGATWVDFNMGFSDVDAAAQEEFLVAGNTIFCTALFDIYSMESTGIGLGETTAPTTLVFPTVFEHGFTLRDPATNGTFHLIDANGRTISTSRVVAGQDFRFDRGGLPPGSYTAVLHDPLSGTRTALGTLIAR
jgi:hypothetical protein